MKDEIIKNIIELYLSGVGSTTICKNLKISKKIILEIINESGIKRNRLLSDEFYSNFWKEGDMWCGYWICNSCRQPIKFKVKTKSLINRTIKRKNICRNCYKNSTKGDGNIFFNKKHNEESKNKISKKKTGIKTSDHMGKPEYRELVRRLANERWASGKMETTREKLSNLMKTRIKNGEIRGYIRSKAEDELIEQLTNQNIDTIPNYRIETKIFDIYIPKFNLLIEYNGDYWHCNPIKYESGYFNKKKNKTAKEIWDYDNEKLYLAKKSNYNIEVIWESDYKKNKNIINNLIKKYNGEIK